MKFSPLAASLAFLAAPLTVSAVISSCSPTNRNVVIEDEDDGDEDSDGGGAGGSDGATGGGSGVSCTNDDQCVETPDFPICIDGNCSPCRNDDDCGDGLPFCSGSGRCVECISGDQCDSYVCLDDSSCLDVDEALFALALTGSTDADCGALEKPCAFIQDALPQMTAGRSHLVLVPTNSAFVISSTLTIDQIFPVVVHGNGVRMDIWSGGFQVTGADVVLDEFYVHGGGTTSETSLVACTNSKLLVTRGTFDNSGVGVGASGCDLRIENSEFTAFGTEGVHADPSCTGTPECARVTEIRGSVFDSMPTAVFANVPDGLIENNVFRNCGTGDYNRCLHLYADGTVVRFNTAVGSGNCSYTGLFACVGANIVLSSNISFANTEVAGPCYDQVYNSCSSNGNTIDHALSEAAYPGTGNRTGDPLFVDLATGDYRLQADSPAIDAGNEDNSPDHDLGGVPRPQGDAPDIGAFEYAE
ncbi:MAG TPA: choice-of-anchor Q domain-containing protein [Polyangiaceae bacterium]|nr:choice-of-anchor Q domain-containing protein [Polyangiaceae bacterium]